MQPRETTVAEDRDRPVLGSQMWRLGRGGVLQCVAGDVERVKGGPRLLVLVIQSQQAVKELLTGCRVGGAPPSLQRSAMAPTVPTLLLASITNWAHMRFGACSGYRSPYGDGRRGSTPPGSNVADEAFRHLDQDGDGYLSADEFITAIVEYWSSDDPDGPGNWAMGRPAYER